MRKTNRILKWSRVAVVVALGNLLESSIEARQPDCCRPTQGCATTAGPSTDDDPTAADVNGPDDNTGAVAAAPTIFSAPAPTGEVSGARAGFGLPGMRLTLPRLSLETPELKLLGFSRSRRDPQMHIDASAAPASYQNPLLFGQIPSGTQQFQPGPTGAAASAGGNPNNPANAANVGEGCVSAESQRIEMLCQQVQQLQSLLAQQQQQGTSGNPAPAAMMDGTSAHADPWTNSRNTEVRECEQQVAELSGQLLQLQQLVQKLAEIKESQSTTQKETVPSRPKSREVTPWAEEKAELATNDESQEMIRQQAERIARLEEHLSRLVAASPAEQTTAETTQVEATQPKLSNQRPTKPAPTPTTRGVLGKVGMALSRR